MERQFWKESENLLRLGFSSILSLVKKPVPIILHAFSPRLERGTCAHVCAFQADLWIDSGHKVKAKIALFCDKICNKLVYFHFLSFHFLYERKNSLTVII